ncbi:TonB-dependent siderophore receptor [Bordetella genomosp. 10]|uniref:TonB-dependent siderophore receptor n=2 Tax=Bordetella genomosp. 10 TaxID=1416804 RepID=A0A261S9K4_9BORD|nr:TonB-dependent siderophore receptor [Bordetella genomosp. 10]
MACAGLLLVIGPAFAQETAPRVAADKTGEDIAAPGGGDGNARATTGNAAASQVQSLPAVTVVGDTGGAAASSNSISKMALTPREVPQSLTVIPREQIQQQNLRAMEDVMWQAPGVVVQPYTNLTTNYYVRGLQVTSYEIDGVPVPLADTANAPVDMSAYDSVEILHGANGLLHGSGNPSATVNLVRKRPPREFSLSGSVSTGSWDSYRASVDIGGPFNEAGTARGLLGATYDRRGYAVDRVNRKSQSVYGITELDVAPGTLVTLGFQYDTTQSVPDMGGVPMAKDGSSLGLPRSAYLGADWQRFNWQTTRAFGSVQQQLGNGWKAKLSAEYQRMSSNLKYDTAYGAVDPATGAGASLMGAAYKFYHYDRSVDLNVQGPIELFGRKHELLFGLSYANADNEQFTGKLLSGTGVPVNVYTWDPGSVPEPAVSAYSLQSETDVTEKGAYAMGRFKLFDPLTLVLGGRLSWWDEDTLAAQYKPGRQFTPYGGLIWDFARDWSVYASYAAVFQPQTRYRYDGSLIDPVKGNTYEAGIKGELADGALDVGAALFRAALTNNAQVDPDHPCAGTACYYVNGGKVRSQGIELTAVGHITPYWNISGGYTFDTTKYVRDTTNSGAYATFNPKHMLRIWTNYALPWDGRRWSVGSGIQAQSAYTVASGNTTLRQGGYALVNLRVGYRIDKNWEAALNVNNVFDRKYYQSFSSAAWSNRYGDPANIAVSLRGVF